MEPQETRRHLVVIALINFVVLVIGVVGAVGVKKFFGAMLNDGHPAFLSLAVAAIALTTFFGALALEKSTAFSGEGQMRRAITVAVVTAYLVIVSVVTFYVPWEDQYSQLAQTLIGSFTATVSVVVVFFFGSSAYLDARSDRKQEEPTTKTPRDT